MRGKVEGGGWRDILYPVVIYVLSNFDWGGYTEQNIELGF